MKVNWPDFKIPPINLWSAPKQTIHYTETSFKGRVKYSTKIEINKFYLLREAGI